MFARYLGSHLSSLNNPPTSRKEWKVSHSLYFLHSQLSGQEDGRPDLSLDVGGVVTLGEIVVVEVMVVDCSVTPVLQTSALSSEPSEHSCVPSHDQVCRIQ